ncbi:MAG: Hsp20/alpha crystallin family protein [Bacteroidales bacterium]|nr:Hsp20/alpha crystallin family protein [Bacteroidales bacterium]
MTLIHYRNPIAYRDNGHRRPRTFDEMVDELLGKGNHHGNRSCNPSANIYESDNEYRIELAVPGLRRDQIRVTIDRDVLKLYAAAPSEERKEEDHYQFEFDYSNFERSFIIPDTIESEKITASYDQGILHVHLPKREDQINKSPKDIRIK